MLKICAQVAAGEGERNIAEETIFEAIIRVPLKARPEKGSHQWRQNPV